MVTKWLPPPTKAAWSPVGKERKELLISMAPEQAPPCILLVHWFNSESITGRGGQNYRNCFSPVGVKVWSQDQQHQPHLGTC